jgi:hypothetical protein
MTTEKQKIANKKWRQNNKEYIKIKTNEYSKKYYQNQKGNQTEKYQDLLNYAKEINNWNYFLNNYSIKKEIKLFMNILL